MLIEQWRRHYNRVRPHSALGYRPPAPEAMEIPPLLGEAAASRPRDRITAELTYELVQSLGAGQILVSMRRLYNPAAQQRW